MTTTTHGWAELQRMLKELPQAIEAKVMRGALREGQRVLMEEAKLQAPVDAGALRNSIRIRFRRKSQTKGWVRMQLVAGNKAAWYAHLIEYGTASYYTGNGRSKRKPYVIKSKKGGLSIGGRYVDQAVHPGIKPQPFMRRAYDMRETDAINAIAAHIAKAVPIEARRLAK